jgi:hypothetical protein
MLNDVAEDRGAKRLQPEFRKGVTGVGKPSALPDQRKNYHKGDVPAVEYCIKNAA